MSEDKKKKTDSGVSKITQRLLEGAMQVRLDRASIEDAIFQHSVLCQTLFDKDFNDFRNAQILSFSRANLSKVTLRSRLDTATFYAKDTANWTYSNDRYLVLNDSFNTYLNSINHLSLRNLKPVGGKFYDASRDFKDIKKIENQLVIYFKEDSATLTAYRRERHFILHSTQNPESYFQVDSVGFIFQNTEGYVRLKRGY